MKLKDIEIKFVKTWNEDEIVELYKAGGWWKNHYNKSGISDLIKGSFVFAVVINKKGRKAIGMGRVISDGVSDAYIQDLIILPEYQKFGIGKKLVEKLVKYCQQQQIKWIALIAEPNQDGFYSKIGFKKMKNYIPMKLED